MKGRKRPGSPPPWASKGSPSHLQCRIWRQRFTLQWKAEISNHTSDRPRVPRVISLPAVDYLVGFVKAEILFSYSADSNIHVFKCDAEAFQHNLSACQGMYSYPKDTKSHQVAIQDFRQILHPGCHHTLGFESYFVLSGTCKAKDRHEMPKLKKSATCSRFCKIKDSKKIPERKEEGGEFKKRCQLNQMHREVPTDFHVLLSIALCASVSTC